MVRALAGCPSHLPPAGMITPEELDGGDPSETFQVLDADSSQQEALALARKGASFVLQGPPGTGKSQTIANIIAETLAAGKTVLFVSEKMAALEVVKRRLDDRGLGEYCLELHSRKANRQEVAAELGRCLHPKAPATAPRDQLEELARLRKRLNDHAVRSTRCAPGAEASFYQINSELVGLRAAHDLSVHFPDLHRMSVRDLEAMGAAGARAGEEHVPSEEGQRHPWMDCTLGLLEGERADPSWRASCPRAATSPTRYCRGRPRWPSRYDMDRPATLADYSALASHLRLALPPRAPTPAWLRDPHNAARHDGGHEGGVRSTGQGDGSSSGPL